ncbi:MAG: LysE family transporter [Paracoccaceae bacterium]
MSGVELAVLWLAWVLGGASPGPATLALAGTGMRRGRPTAMALAAGIVTGSAAWGVAAGLGLGAAMLAEVWLAETLRYVGAAYIMWLALRSLRSALRPSSLPNAAALPSTRPERAFVHGLLLHLTNPKAIFSWGAVFAVAVPVGAGPSTIIGVWLLLLTGSVLVFFGYALLFSRPSMMARYLRARRWIEGAFGLLFGGAAIALVTAGPA